MLTTTAPRGPTPSALTTNAAVTGWFRRLALAATAATIVVALLAGAAPETGVQAIDEVTRAEEADAGVRRYGTYYMNRSETRRLITELGIVSVGHIPATAITPWPYKAAAIASGMSTKGLQVYAQHVYNQGRCLKFGYMPHSAGISSYNCRPPAGNGYLSSAKVNRPGSGYAKPAAAWRRLLARPFGG